MKGDMKKVKLAGYFSEEEIEKFKEKGGIPASVRDGRFFTKVQTLTFDQETDVDSQIRDIFNCVLQLECSHTKLQEKLDYLNQSIERSLESFTKLFREELNKTLILNKLYDIKREYDFLIKLSKTDNYDYRRIEETIFGIQSSICKSQLKNVDFRQSQNAV